MAKKLVSEVLEEASKIIKKSDRIRFLQQNKTPGLTDILRINYDDTVISALPSGAPSFKRDDAPKGYEYTRLNKRIHNLNISLKDQLHLVSSLLREKGYS